MNITRVRAERYRSYDELDVAIPDGALAICGANGAGKSSLVELIPLALFGPPGRSLAPYLSDDEHDAPLVIAVEFEHAGDEFRVRRTYSPRGRGQTKVDLEQRVDATWMPLTAETAAATQDVLQSILGLSRETFCASAYLSQGDSAAFTEASPRDRKAILAEVLGLGVWEELRMKAGGDLRARSQEQTLLDGRIAVLAERGGDLAVLGEAKLRAEEVAFEREGAHAAADAAFDLASERVTEIERSESAYRSAQAAAETARARLAERQGVVDRAAAAKVEAVEVQSQIAAWRDPAPWIAELESRRRELAARAEQRREAESVRDRYLADAEDARRQAETLSVERERVGQEHGRLAAQAEHLALDDALEVRRCPTCEQALAGDAHEIALARIREQRDDAERRLVALARRVEEQAAHALSRKAAAEGVVIPDAPTQEIAAIDQELVEAREAELHVERLRERARSLEATVAEATPEVMAEVERLDVDVYAAEQALAVIDEPEPGALDAARVAAVTAKAELDIATRALTEARENLIRACSALEQAQSVAADLSEARIKRDELVDEIGILTTLERVYGRDGIPAHIVEARAIPSIEAEASRILSALGTDYRVELRTQRELKSGDGLADTLDVVVIGEGGARAYETFSGGERTRFNAALRLALASLLAHRRGAESRVLIFDEPEFLDSAGQIALAAVLRDLADAGTYDKVITVSHADALRDIFDNCIVIEKIDGRSVIAA